MSVVYIYVKHSNIMYNIVIAGANCNKKRRLNKLVVFWLFMVNYLL